MIPPKHPIKRGHRAGRRPRSERRDRTRTAAICLSAHSPPAAPDNVHALDWALAPCKFVHGDLHLRIKALCATTAIKMDGVDHQIQDGQGCLGVQENKGASKIRPRALYQPMEEVATSLGRRTACMQCRGQTAP